MDSVMSVGSARVDSGVYLPEYALATISRMQLEPCILEDESLGQDIDSACSTGTTARRAKPTTLRTTALGVVAAIRIKVQTHWAASA